MEPVYIARHKNSECEEYSTRDFVGIVLHRDGFIVDLSNETAAVFGYRRDDLIGKPVTDVIRECENGAGVDALGYSSNGSLFPLEILRSASRL